jgi:ribosomal protein L13
MHPGGLKSRTALEMRTNYAEKMIELAVKGMLPKNSLAVKRSKNYTYMLAQNIRTKHNNLKFTNFAVNKEGGN